MYKYGCVSSVVWNSCADLSLDNSDPSVYYWYYLQVGLFDLANYYSAGMDWSLGLIYHL